MSLHEYGRRRRSPRRPKIVNPMGPLARRLRVRHRLLGRFAGGLICLTQYPATGPGPDPGDAAQRLDCPHRGRGQGCWVRAWAGSEAGLDV